MIKERLVGPRRWLTGVSWAFLGLVTYNLALVPLLSDRPYWEIVGERMTAQILPWALVYALVAIVAVVALRKQHSPRRTSPHDHE